MNNRCLTAQQLGLHVSIASPTSIPTLFLGRAQHSPCDLLQSPRCHQTGRRMRTMTMTQRRAAAAHPFPLVAPGQPKAVCRFPHKAGFLGGINITGKIGDSLSEDATVCTRLSFFCLTDGQVYRILSNNRRNLQKSQFTSK